MPAWTLMVCPVRSPKTVEPVERPEVVCGPSRFPRVNDAGDVGLPGHRQDSRKAATCRRLSAPLAAGDLERGEQP